MTSGVFMLVFIDRLNKINYANCFFYCQQWSLLRIYNWWIHERSSRLNFFHFHAVFGGNLTVSNSVVAPPAPPRPREILDPPVCWPDSVGDEHLSSIVLTALFTNSAIHKAAGSSVQLPSVPKMLLTGYPQRLFLLLAPIHSLWVIFQWDSGKME